MCLDIINWTCLVFFETYQHKFEFSLVISVAICVSLKVDLDLD